MFKWMAFHTTVKNVLTNFAFFAYQSYVGYGQILKVEFLIHFTTFKDCSSEETSVSCLKVINGSRSRQHRSLEHARSQCEKYNRTLPIINSESWFEKMITFLRISYFSKNIRKTEHFWTGSKYIRSESMVSFIYRFFWRKFVFFCFFFLSVIKFVRCFVY